MGWARKLFVCGTNSPIQTLRVSPSNDEAHHWSCREATSSPVDLTHLQECLSPCRQMFLHNSCRRLSTRTFASFFFSLCPTFQWCHVAKELWSFVCIRQQ
jgi:hypothetical protein